MLLITILRKTQGSGYSQLRINEASLGQKGLASSALEPCRAAGCVWLHWPLLGTLGSQIAPLFLSAGLPESSPQPSPPGRPHTPKLGSRTHICIFWFLGNQAIFHFSCKWKQNKTQFYLSWELMAFLTDLPKMDFSSFFSPWKCLYANFIFEGYFCWLEKSSLTSPSPTLEHLKRFPPSSCFPWCRRQNNHHPSVLPVKYAPIPDLLGLPRMFSLPRIFQ